MPKFTPVDYDPFAVGQDVIENVKYVESRGNPNAVSPKGAIGTMQTMPGTLRDPGFGVTPARDNSPEELERVGKDYLDAMYAKYEDMDKALAAYNFGPKNVDDAIKVHGDKWTKGLPAETKGYIKKVKEQPTAKVKFTPVDYDPFAENTPQNEVKQRSWRDVPLEAITNIPESGINMAKGMYQAVRHPIETGKTLGKTAIGAAELLIPGEQGSEPYARGVGQFFAERYGGEENLKKTMAEDPVGFLADVSTVFSGGSSIASKIPGLTKAANVAKTVGEVTNPISVATKVGKFATSKAAKHGGELFKETIGTLTGSGKGFVEEAIKGTEAFRKGMRGELTGEEVVQHAKDALSQIKAQRAQTYQDELAGITAGTGSLPQSTINLTPIADKLTTLMKQYNIKTSTSGGKLTIDTSRVAMGKSGIKDIEDIIDTVGKWGSKPGDNTVLGLDVLKRQLDDFYSDSSQARGFVTALRTEVKNVITKAEPRYETMTKGYREASELINDIESNLMLRKSGMSGRITADQTLRRLTSALRENFEMRKDLLNTLGNQGGIDVAGEVAGYSGSQLIPRGLIGKGMAAGGSYGMLAYGMNPWVWPILGASSPRVMGEFLRAYGKAAKFTTQPAGKAISTMAEQIAKPSINIPMYQAGRLAIEAEEEG